MDERDDAALVSAARRGEKAAFGELLARHLRLAESLARRFLGDRDLARDAAQEAAVLALVSLDRLAAPERFGAWLGGIALNVARRWSRRETRISAAPAVALDPGPSPEEAAETALLREKVRLAVAQLAPGQRDAVYLFYLSGLTHREVAGELGISVGAVKARLHQGRGALTKLLATEMAGRSTMSTEDEEFVPVAIETVLRRDHGLPERRNHVVVLREIDGERRLTIWIGKHEAVALALTLESEQMPRPMAYQFALSLLDGTGTTVQEVRICRLDGAIYYAVAVLNGPDGLRRVDARPSDVLNLAALTGAPVSVESRLFQPSSESAWPEGYSTGMAEIIADERANAIPPRQRD